MKKNYYCLIIPLLFLFYSSMSYSQIVIANINGKQFVDELIAKSCNLQIGKIQQLPIGLVFKKELCFVYDASGNYIGTRNCDDLPLVPRTMSQVDTEQEEEEEVVEMSLEEIKSHIKIYPNPTEGMVNVLFDEEILGKIVKAEVFNPNGALIKSNLIMSSDNHTSFDIWGYPNGVYVLKFTLNTNGFISINILKK